MAWRKLGTSPRPAGTAEDLNAPGRPRARTEQHYGCHRALDAGLTASLIGNRGRASRVGVLPGILVEELNLDHALHRKNETLERDVVHVLDHHDHFCDGALCGGVCGVVSN